MTDEGVHDDDGDTRRYVDHAYHDFSRYTIEQGGEIPKHKKSGSNFTARLYHMLANPNNSHIIAWMAAFLLLGLMLTKETHHISHPATNGILT